MILADTLVFDAQRVVAFVQTRVPLPASQGMCGIGLSRGGQIIAGVLYEGVNANNAWMHVAALPGKLWTTRPFLTAVFAYPFIQCGVKAVRAYTEASNVAVCRLLAHLGFLQEAVLVGAASDGGDVVVHMLPKERCGYVDPK